MNQRLYLLGESISIGLPLRQLIHSSTSRLRKLRTLVLAMLALGLVAPSAPGQGGLIGALLAADPGYQIVERGEDYAVYQRVSAVTNAASGVTAMTNQFTLLENCLNYFENGQWKESDDATEPFPDGG